MGNLSCRLLIYYNLLINRLLTSAFVLVNGIVFSRSNGLTNSVFNSMFDELREVKYFKELTDFKKLIL